MMLRHYFKKDPYKKSDIKSRTHRLHVIIFSKDRPCQLSSLLQSINDHITWPIASLHILFRSSSVDFERGYEIAHKENTVAYSQWRQEVSFRSDLLDLLSAIDSQDLLMFLVDDDIVFRNVNLGPVIDSFNSSHLFISLRVCPSYVPLQGWMPHFHRRDSLLEWEWKFHRRKSNAWNYPFSLDGNIYHADRICEVISCLKFKAPNSLESAMHEYRKVRWVSNIRTGIASVPPCVVNNPLNRVQAEGETWHKNIDTAWINNRYLRGHRIDNAQLYTKTPNHTHCDLGLPWINEFVLASERTD